MCSSDLPGMSCPEPSIWHERCQLVRLPRHYKSELLLPAPPCKEGMPGSHPGGNACAAGGPCTARTFTMPGTGKQRYADRTGYFHKRILHPCNRIHIHPLLTVVCGYTDLRAGMDRLAALVEAQYALSTVYDQVRLCGKSHYYHLFIEIPRPFYLLMSIFFAHIKI